MFPASPGNSVFNVTRLWTVTPAAHLQKVAIKGSKCPRESPRQQFDSGTALKPSQTRQEHYLDSESCECGHWDSV